MKISTEFSKYAAYYGKYNIIQERVAKKLVDTIQGSPQAVLDLGCGNGSVYKKLDWPLQIFIGVDFAQGMLSLHPKDEHITCMYGDFNDAKLFRYLQRYSFDYIISASALQWADDLQSVSRNIAALNAPVALAIFTSGTFQTLNQTAKLQPLLRSSQEIQKIQEDYFPDAHFELVQYKLVFDSVREMFRYIKKSGVSGSRRVLSYKETKKLMQSYPLNYLEFEVAFIVH